MLLFVCFQLCLSCQHKQRDISPNTIQINFEQGVVEDLINSYTYIALETSDDILLSGIDKLYIDEENNLYILDKKNFTVQIYSDKGFFLNKISKRGDGPEEYHDASDFCVDKEYVYILSRVDKKIVKYTKDSRFVDYMSLDDYYDYTHVDEDFIYLYSNYSNNKQKNLVIYSKEGKEINSFLPFERNQSFSYPPTPFNRQSNGNLLITQQYDHRVYQACKDSVHTIATIGFNTKDRIPSDFEEIGFDKLYKDLANKSLVKRINYVCEKNDKIYILYHYNYTNNLSFIDLTTKGTLTCSLSPTDKYPFLFSEPLGFHNDYLIGHLHASIVLMFDPQFKSDKNEGGLLSEEDNPVIFFHKIAF